MKTNNLIIIILILCVFIPVVFSCSQQAPLTTPTVKPEPAKGPIYGGTLKVGYSADAGALGFTPVVVGFPGTDMRYVSMQTLGMYDEKGVIQPLLAASWKLDASTKTLIVNLNKGIKFHDGSICDSNAIKFNVDLFKSEGRTELNMIKSVDIIDDYTIRFNLSEWNNTVFDEMCNYVIMISPTAYNKNGKDWCYSNPVGTGPFQFVNWQRDVKQTYKKFDNYWEKGKPYLDAMELVIIKDPMTQLAAFKAGELNALWSVAPNDVKGLEAETTKYNIIKRTGTISYCLMPDSLHADSPLSNLLVRRAISYAINNQALVDSVLLGYGISLNQYAQPTSWGYNPDVKGYPYDPDKAKKLLTEAGFPNGFKTQIYAEPMPANQMTATAIQGFLSKIGITAEIVTAEPAKFGTYLTQGWSNGLILVPCGLNPDLSLEMKKRIITNSSLYSKSMAHFSDIDELLKQSSIAPDLDSKKSIVQKVQKLIVDEYDQFFPLYLGMQLSATDIKVHDWEFASVFRPMMNRPQNAWLSK
jgi:peptide/nickel transport system substrate-binding protein